MRARPRAAQALHIGAILLLAALIGVSLNLSLGRDFAGVLMIVAPLLSAFLWPAISLVMALPRLRRGPGQALG